jgi:hypothetical protein
MACSLSLFLARLFSFSISGMPVLFPYFWHACSLSLFLARLFSFSNSGMPVLFLYFHGILLVFSSVLFIVVLVLLIGIQTASLFE